MPQQYQEVERKIFSPAVWRKRLTACFGEKRLGGAHFLPEIRVAQEKIPAVNRWMLRMAASVGDALAALLLTPQMKAEDIAPLLDHSRVAGFKVYHTFSHGKPAWDALPSEGEIQLGRISPYSESRSQNPEVA